MLFSAENAIFTHLVATTGHLKWPNSAMSPLRHQV